MRPNISLRLTDPLVSSSLVSDRLDYESQNLVTDQPNPHMQRNKVQREIVKFYE